MTIVLNGFRASEVHTIYYSIEATFDPPIELTELPRRGTIADPRRYVITGATCHTTVDARLDSTHVQRIVTKFKSLNVRKDGSLGAATSRFRYGLGGVTLSNADQDRLDGAKNDALDWFQDAHNQSRAKEGLL